MRKIIMLAATLVASFCVTIPAMGAIPDNFVESKHKVQWSDEFTGTTLNSNYWTPQLGNGEPNIWEWGNSEKEWYKAENLRVSNGTLKIDSKYEPNAGKSRDKSVTYNFSSGRMNSSGKVEVGYGYVEAKIKVPSAKGIWPAFWMLGTNGKTWPACGEIDILEAFNTNKIIQSTIHYPKLNGADQYMFRQKTLDDKTQWHTYGCYRDGERIGFYIDRQLFASWSTADDASGKCSVLNDKYYILLNVACGGNLAGGMPDTSLNSTMEVDYVRYYVDKPDEPTTKSTVTKAQTVKKPAKVKIKKAKNVKKRKIKLTFAKVKGAKGYKIRWCDQKNFDGYEEKTTTKRTYTLKGLTKGKWYIKVRAYAKDGKSKKWGPWSKVKKVTVKK
ncbi:MAG: family 16 glycosylhydrolase [Eubacterium sp.]|nr:family 16 glycosylhydrolase [Eubacterium sp.]